MRTIIVDNGDCPCCAPVPPITEDDRRAADEQAARIAAPYALTALSMPVVMLLILCGVAVTR